MRIYAGVVLAALVAALLVTLLHKEDSQPVGAAQSAEGPTAQLRWLLGATHEPPLSAAQFRVHFAGAYRHSVGGSVAFGEELAQLGPLTLLSSRATNQPTGVYAVAASGGAHGATTKYIVELSVNRAGLIDVLHTSTLLPSPPSWSAVDHRLESLASQVSFATERIGRQGRCDVVHGLHAYTPRPLGSAFKLYVLGALARDIAHKHARWDEGLAIRDAWKSFPSGTLQDRRAGTRLALREYANQMISQSDNTAADHLVHFLGQTKLQRQLHIFGNRHARLNVPFLTTRELFTLKGFHYPRLADHFLAAPSRERARIIRRVDRVPRSAVHVWTAPRDVSSIEWFASPTDICRAFSGLLSQNRNPRLKAVGRALSIYDGQLLLDPTDYPVTWFKGGSEPGVLSENYLVKAADGAVLVTSFSLSDPRQILDEDTIAPELAAIVRGSLALADPSKK